LRIKEQETRLILHEYEYDDDNYYDDDDDDEKWAFFWFFSHMLNNLCISRNTNKRQ